MSAHRLLIVDDQVEIATTVATVAERLGYEVMTTTDPAACMRLHESFRPDVVILDIVMPGIDGIELLRSLGAAGSTARILVMTGFSERYLRHADVLAEHFGLAAVTTMMKPIRLEALRAFLQSD